VLYQINSVLSLIMVHHPYGK